MFRSFISLAANFFGIIYKNAIDSFAKPELQQFLVD